MRNLIHIFSLLAAITTWLGGIFLGFQQPLWGIAGTCCTLGLLALALKTDRVRPRL